MVYLYITLKVCNFSLNNLFFCSLYFDRRKHKTLNYLNDHIPEFKKKLDKVKLAKVVKKIHFTT